MQVYIIPKNGEEGEWPYKVRCNECAHLAQAELDFLKSLRDD
jgi:hypothetical protein